MIGNIRIRHAFKRVRHDMVELRNSFSSTIFSVTDEQTRLLLRIEALEKRLDEIERKDY